VTVPARTVVLDNEAVQALADTGHPKHRRVLAVVEAAARRNLRRAGTTTLVVPTAVQVEAGWVRTAPRSAALNRLRADRPALGRTAAEQGARLVAATGVSVADAHIGAALAATPAPHAVLTSDEADIRLVAGRVGVTVTVAVI
jgi:hypothetical protein